MGTIFNILLFIPSMLSLLGGVIGTVWLICLGDWKFAICWFLLGVCVSYLIKWLHFPLAFLSTFATSMLEANHIYISYCMFFLNRFISYTFFYIWTLIAYAYIVGDVTTNYLIPSLLLAFSIVTQSTDSKGIQENNLVLIQVLTVLLSDFFYAVYIFFTGTDVNSLVTGSLYTLFFFIRLCHNKWLIFDEK